jgi:predicted RNA-binding Zn ribbon-like protein
VTSAILLLGDLPAEELQFRFLSGRASLDLSATVGERWRRNFERLRTPHDLSRWIKESGLLSSAPTTTAEDLERSRLLRDAIYRSARAIMANKAVSRSDERVLTLSAAPAPLQPVISSGKVTWRADEPGTAALSTVARDAIDLFTGPYRERIRECATDDCALLFVDTSRPGQRRWCSGASCGGRARAVAYRSRKRG